MTTYLILLVDCGGYTFTLEGTGIGGYLLVCIILGICFTVPITGFSPPEGYCKHSLSDDGRYFPNNSHLDGSEI